MPKQPLLLSAGRLGLGRDFEWLWRSYALSRFGVAFSAGAVAIIAVQNLGASALQVALVFGVSRLVAALLSIPVGVIVEQRRKRPVLMRADIIRSVTTIAVPVLLWTDQLTIFWLGVVMTADAYLSIVSAAAANAHLKDLVAPTGWSSAFSRLSTTDWIFTAAFAPLGGLAVTVAGPTMTLTVDALTYVGAAAVLTRIAAIERIPSLVDRSDSKAFLREVLGGWTYIWGSPTLRALFNNAMLFGASLVIVSPLLAVLALRDLGLEAWQYTTILGAPAIGGIAGSVFAPRVERRLSTRSTLLLFGSARTLWTIWIAVSPAGVSGFVVILAAETLLMLFAGVFNPVFTAHQAAITDDDYMARTSAAWRASAMTAQPIFMIGGGVMSGLIGIRPTITVAGGLLMVSSLLLPWKTLGRSRPALSRDGAVGSKAPFEGRGPSVRQDGSTSRVSHISN